MAIRYTKTKDDDEQKNVADPWHALGLNYGAPISTKEVPEVTLGGQFSDVSIAGQVDNEDKS